MPRWVIALVAAVLVGACGSEPQGPAGTVLPDGQGRYRVSVQTTPGTAGAPGEIRLRVEPTADWHLALDAPARLALESAPGLHFEPEVQRGEDAVQRTEALLEFASSFRATATEPVARGVLKFGVCQADEQCSIVRRHFEIPLEVSAVGG